MLILKKPISLEEIQSSHNEFFEKMVKVVVDIEEGFLALDAELHADLEQFLLEEHESKQENLWGANVYFDPPGFIEFTSLINIRPAQGNKSMVIQDENIQKQVENIVKKLIV